METNHQINDAVDAARDEYPRASRRKRWMTFGHDTIERVLLSWFENELNHDC